MRLEDIRPEDQEMLDDIVIKATSPEVKEHMKKVARSQGVHTSIWVGDLTSLGRLDFNHYRKHVQLYLETQTTQKLGTKFRVGYSDERCEGGLDAAQGKSAGLTVYF
jgi:hypothetical protein